MAKTAYVALKRFWSLDLKKMFEAGEVVPDEVAKKALKFGLVKAQADTLKKEDDR